MSVPHLQGFMSTSCTVVTLQQWQKSVHRCLPKCSNPSMHNSTFARMMHKERLSQKNQQQQPHGCSRKQKMFATVYFLFFLYLERSSNFIISINIYKKGTSKGRNMWWYTEKPLTLKDISRFSPPQISIPGS